MKYTALVISLLGLITWLEPRIGFFVSYLAFFLGYLAYRKVKSKISVVAMVIGGLGFLLSLLNIVLSFAMF